VSLDKLCLLLPIGAMGNLASCAGEISSDLCMVVRHDDGAWPVGRGLAIWRAGIGVNGRMCEGQVRMWPVKTETLRE